METGKLHLMKRKVEKQVLEPLELEKLESAKWGQMKPLLEQLK
jgi:hypothetical protein